MPFRPGDVRRVRAALPEASERRVCRLLEVPRSALLERSCRGGLSPIVNEFLAGEIEALIKRHPTYGYRRIWAVLRFRLGLPVNRKAVYRILKLKGWFCHERATRPGHGARQPGREEQPALGDGYDPHLLWRGRVGASGGRHRLPRPRDRGLRVLAAGPGQGGRTGSGIGLPLPLRDYPARGRDAGCEVRQRPRVPEPALSGGHEVLPTDAGVHHALHPGAERHHRTLLPQSERGVRLAALFEDFEHARRAIRDWIRWYREERPHQSLGYLSPAEYRAQQLQVVA